MPEWVIFSAIATVCTALGAAGGRIFGFGRHSGEAVAQIAALNVTVTSAMTEIRAIGEKLHSHEVSDATAFAELRTSLAAISRDQVGVENRIASLIDGVRIDVRAASSERNQMLSSMSERIDALMRRTGT